IGKVAIRDEILLKPGRLTDEQFEIVKTHTSRGAEALDSALAAYPDAAFLQMAREVAVYHHERYDGQGYPEGLTGELIPLSARIVALADAYDTITSRRVYKEAGDFASARRKITAGRGTQFDPDVVDAFLSVETQFVGIRNRFPDVGCDDAAPPSDAAELAPAAP
ncbi:MAG TPA: HD domain-containing phosphohydrolase, partial [Pirellulales bacterium]|nr:HD domain-containing phosphohydrolase [Pirellulales bacterium]